MLNQCDSLCAGRTGCDVTRLGVFYTYSTRFIDTSWGFAMGWNNVFQWAIVLPLEFVVAGLTVGCWNLDINVFLRAIVIVNVFGVLGFAEEEFWSSVLKLSAVVIFMIIGMVLVCGGGPSNGIYSEHWGARLWYDPSAFKNGSKVYALSSSLSRLHSAELNLSVSRLLSPRTQLGPYRVQLSKYSGVPRSSISSVFCSSDCWLALRMRATRRQSLD